MHPNNNLRLNVGFFIGQNVGYSRDFLFESAHLTFDPDLYLSDFGGAARITRTAQGLLIQGKMNATILSECVRCLTNIELPLKIDFTELYAFSSQSVTDSGLLLPEDAHINLAPLVREYMLLEVPISPVCRADCRGLCPICGENLNDTTCEHNDQAVESRLSMLKTLLEQED
ncbi:MAG: hypothetical protein A2W33_05475 [Chloroflexi bacterium RBG_16_52_11]|nr:MAG: hypothetical protein A2W33_05475 [Chloroflexi bacterium RBG_16_52_11]